MTNVDDTVITTDDIDYNKDPIILSIEEKYKLYYQLYNGKQEEIIYAYQNGDPTAADKLITLYHPIMKSFAMFFKNDRYFIACTENIKKTNYTAYMIQQFVKLFVPKKMWKIKGLRYEPAKKAMRGIKLKCYKLDFWDMYDEMAEVILKLAKVFRVSKDDKGNIIFPMTFFEFTLQRIHYMTYEVFVYKKYMNSNDLLLTFNNVSIEEIVEKEEDNLYPQLVEPEYKYCERAELEFERKEKVRHYDSLVFREDYVNPYTDETFNVNWIIGSVCTKPFNILTIFEREYLINKYVYGMTDKDIAKITKNHETYLNGVNKRIRTDIPSF